MSVMNMSSFLQCQFPKPNLIQLIAQEDIITIYMHSNEIHNIAALIVY